MKRILTVSFSRTIAHPFRATGGVRRRGSHYIKGK